MPKNKAPAFAKGRGKKQKVVLGELLETPNDEELKYLESLVLGNGTEVFSKDSSDSESEEVSEKGIADAREELNRPAWEDEDEDDNATFNEVVEKQGRRCKTGISGSKDYNTVLKQQYQNVMGAPRWANRKNKKEQYDNILGRCGNLVKKSIHLEKNKIELKKLKDLNSETYTEGPVIKVVEFHPTSTVALVAGLSGVASLFQVDGKQNTKLQSIQFDRFPIHCASFLKNGEEFIAGSQHHSFFYSHNLMTGQSLKANNLKIADITNMKNFKVSPDNKIIAVCGRFGKIFLLCGTTKELICELKMNGNVNALDFNDSSSKIYSHGSDGEVYIWDVRARSCIHRFIDEGCIDGTSIAISPNQQLVACGSSSGVVNIYENENVPLNKNCQPVKTFYNLVTSINKVKFNATSEVLAISSDLKDNSVKLIHCPSMTVFSNFPSFESKLARANCVNFSPNSGYFAVGNNRKSAHLFRLKFYGNY